MDTFVLPNPKLVSLVIQNIILFLVLGVPTFGEGSTWLGQNPNFFQKFHLKAPLTVSDQLYQKTTRIVTSSVIKNPKNTIIHF